MELLELRDILTEARAHIEEGWIKGNYSQRTGYRVTGVCAVGALRVVLPAWHRERGDSIKYSEALGYVGKILDDSIVDFNDHYLTTKRDVLQLFDWAIESVESALEIDMGVTGPGKRIEVPSRPKPQPIPAPSKNPETTPAKKPEREKVPA